MIIRNFYDDKLAQASYLVGCAATGEAIVIDPLRDIAPYIDMAERQGLRITHVTETHIHADYLSGSRELAAATGAQLFLSDEGDELWKYAFAESDGAVLMKNGHIIEVGNLTLEAIHTPGHTPEHMAFLLVDHPAGELAHSLFTGDFIFVGDVGRPDLLERAANFAGTMEKGARVLFQSLQKLSELPDSLLLWPAHGAGSACGKALGGSPVTTLGYERATNWAFQIDQEDKFVDEVLSGQPEPPAYFKEMKRLNKEGPRLLGALPRVPRGAEVVGNLVDVRPPSAIREDFVEGALALPSGKGLTNWSGWMLAYDQPVTLVAETQEQADGVARDLATIGLDVIAAWIPPASLANRHHRRVNEVEPCDVPSDGYVLDVRGVNEHLTNRVTSAKHIPLGELGQRVGELPTDQPVYVHCASGYRSLIAMSVLSQSGIRNAVEIRGGMAHILESCPERVTLTGSA